jgi:subtilisin-like proprotein convertase family protein
MGGNSYYILTLTYDTNTPPAPLPTNAGDDPTTIGSTTAGCYNSDFLTERLCLTVNNCCTANAGDIDQVEMCQGAAAPTDLAPLTPVYGGGFGTAPDPAANYSYAYFLTADAAPNNILQGAVTDPATFTYSGLAAGTYRIYGFSYLSSEGPLTNTSAGSPILGVALTSGTCLEATYTYLVVNPIPAVPALADATYCTGQTAAALNATTNGGLSYAWTPAASGPIVTPTTALAGTTTYTVTVTGAGGCTAAQDAVITVNQTPTAPTLVDATYCVGQTAAALDATTVGATYLWNDNSTNPTFTPLTTVAGTNTYTVTVTVNGCSTTADAIITVNSATASITASGATTFCSGGSVTLTANGGGTYLWSNAATTQNITVSASGTYTVTVTAANGCTATASQPVTVNTVSVAIATATPSVVCAGGVTQLNVTSTYTVSGGAAVSIPASGNGTPYPSTLAVANIPVGATIKSINLNGLSHTWPDDLDIYLQSPTGQQVILMSDVGGGSDISGINLILQNGATVLPDNTVLSSGTYAPTNIGAGDAIIPAGLTTNLATFTGNLNGTWSLFARDEFSPDAGSLASWSITFSFPTNPIYAWSANTASGIAGLSSTTIANPTATVTETTTYTVTVTDGDTGCSTTASTTVTVPVVTASIVANGSTAICPGSSVVLTANGGTTYLWSNAATTQSIVASTANTYSVTVSDANGCTATASQAVTVNPASSAPITTNYAICQNAVVPLGEGVSATTCSPESASQSFAGVLVSNGSPFPSYTLTFPPLPPSATITSANLILTNISTQNNSWLSEFRAALSGAVTLAATQISTTDAGGTIASSIIPISSFPTSGGSITLTLSETFNDGGTAIDATVGSATIVVNYAPALNWYSAMTGGTLLGSGTPFNPVGTSLLLDTSVPGTYNLYAECAGSCPSTRSLATFTVNPPPTASIVAGGSTTFCSGGSVALFASGGGTYLWNNTATTQVISATTSGTYSVTVTSAAGCTNSASISVTVNPLPTAGITASGPTTFCAGGSVDLTATGGTTYLWSTGAVSTTITASATGIYTVTVTDGNGCTATASTAVTVNNCNTASIGNYVWNDLNNNGIQDEAATAGLNGVTVTLYPANAGGTPSGAAVGSVVTANDGLGNPGYYQFSNLPAGSYVLQYTLPSGLTYSVVQNGGAVSSSVNTSNTDSNINTTTGYSGIVTLAAGETINTVDAGMTCATVAAAIIPGGSTNICSGSSVTLVATGGGTYLWSNAATTQAIVVNTTGTYTVTVTNAAGCTGTASQAVNVGTITASITPSGATTFCSGSNVSLLASGGTTYLWSNGATTTSIIVTASGTYSVTATSGVCSAVATQSVTVNTVSASSNNNSPICDGRDILLFSNGGGTYNWSGPNGFSSTDQNPSILSGSANYPGAGSWTYNVTVTGTNGCTATSSTIVQVNALPLVAINGDNTICVGETLSLTAAVSNATGSESYSWTGPGGFTAATAAITRTNATTLMSGTYQVLVSNSFGCVQAATVNVLVSPLPNATIAVNQTCNNGVATLLLSVPNAGIGSTYTWSGTGVSGSTNSQTITPIAAGAYTYNITITNGGGCTSTGTLNATVAVCNVACNAVAGTATASSACVGTPITASVSGNNTSAGFTTQLIVTNAGGTIVYIGASPISGLAAGDYLIYSYNYQTAPTPAPVVGGSINTYTTGTNNTGCYDVSNSGTPFSVNSGGPALTGTVSPTQGTEGGTSPFYYNIEVLTIEGGDLPYNFTWDNSGYVRYDIQYTATGATITVYYADNATWAVTISDAAQCGAANTITFNNITGETNTLLDIDSYVITQQSGTTPNGAINITPTGGTCAPNYDYAWSGPDGFTANTQDISGLAYGWYSVILWCDTDNDNQVDANEEQTQGWYWVPRARRGRSKTDDNMLALSAAPNPFSNQTNIEFYVSETAATRVAVYATDGKQVAELFSDIAQADEVYSLTLSADNLPAGIYTVVLNTDKGEYQTYRVVISK